MVSVCVATYNGEKYIKTQLESILTQLESSDEVIISDDGSTDNTLAIVQELGDKRIKIYNHKCDIALRKLKLGGYRCVAQNFENAISHATGDYIFLADQDDVWEMNRIQVVLNLLKEYEVVLCNYKIINEIGEIISDVQYDKEHYPIKNSFIFNILKSRFMCCCLAFKKDLCRFILPFPNKLMSCDQWVGSMGTLVGGAFFTTETVHLYRRHGKNVSTTSEKSNNSLLFKLYFRLYMFVLIIMRYLRTKK